MSRAAAAAAAPRQGSPSDLGAAPGAISRARPRSDSGRPARPFLWGHPGLLHRFRGVPGEALKPLFAKQEPKGRPTRHAKAKATAPVRAPWAAPASEKRNSATNLVDLPVRAIANHFHQLENPGGVLEKRGKGGVEGRRNKSGVTFRPADGCCHSPSQACCAAGGVQLLRPASPRTCQRMQTKESSPGPGSAPHKPFQHPSGGLPARPPGPTRSPTPALDPHHGGGTPTPGRCPPPAPELTRREDRSISTRLFAGESFAIFPSLPFLFLVFLLFFFVVSSRR